MEFGLDSGSTRDKFDGIELEENSYGMPIVKDSCGWSICEVKEMHDIGERKIVIGEVIEQKSYDGKRPLTKKEGFAALDSESVQN